jgi:hypothetical protein
MRVRETQSAFLLHAQGNVFRRGDARQQFRLFAARIHRRHAAPTPTGFAEIISDVSK